MRFARLALLCFFCSQISLAVQAAEIGVHIVDPKNAAVAGAQVELLSGSTGVVVATQTTSAQGEVVFANVAPGQYSVAVLAAGFAPAREAIRAADKSATLTVHLQMAAAAQTVVVTADRSALAEEGAGSKVAALDRDALLNLQPVSASDALRLLPGAVINTAGQRGGLASLFVRGGESRYNKVIIDDVVVNDPGGTFDFGVIPTYQIERVELERGADSALYGSDAMTSVVQFFTRKGHTRRPELEMGADGGTFASAHGYASLAGARGIADYNFFAEQFNTDGQGTNDQYSNSSQGVNVGFVLPHRTLLRLRTRHQNTRSGVPGEWNFEGRPLLPPDLDQRARHNDFLGSAELRTTAPGRWEHRLTGWEYSHRRLNIDTLQELGRVSPAFGNFDFPFADFVNINRAGAEYQGSYTPREWARTVFGYQFEDENGFVGDRLAGVTTHGLRRNHEAYAEQLITFHRFTAVVGGRFVHHENFGNRGIPRAAGSVQLFRGNQIVGGLRLRAGYSEGIKEPRFEESFGQEGFGIIPNLHLRPEQNRAWEAGFDQPLLGGKASLAGTYFHNTFRDLIDFSFDATTFLGQYINVNRALAHGAELEFHARPSSRLRFDAAYTYTATQVLRAPLAFDALHLPGAPLLRRPPHSGNALLSYSAARWGGSLSSSFVGRRADSDFLGLVPPILHAPGYALMNAGGWWSLPKLRYATAYANVENLLDHRYEEVVGFPGSKANFRAGLRFRWGGE